jgi:cell division protein FtsB
MNNLHKITNKTFLIKWRHWRKPLLLTTVGLLIFVFTLIGLVKNINQVFSAKQEINQIKLEIERLDKKNQEVDSLISYLDSTEFLEEEARLKFDLRQPNEKIIVIKQTGTVSQTDETADSIFDLPAPKKIKPLISRNPSLWFKYFFITKSQ